MVETSFDAVLDVSLAFIAVFGGSDEDAVTANPECPAVILSSSPRSMTRLPFISCENISLTGASI